MKKSQDAYLFLLAFIKIVANSQHFSVGFLHNAEQREGCLQTNLIAGMPSRAAW